jgi:predicted lipoprotein with Yx(FWY)xxD motif
MSMRLVLTSSAAVAVLAAAGCASSSSKNGSGGGSNQPAGGSGSQTITVQHDRLTAPDGKTLYYNTVDTATSIKCTGTCASLWPPLTGSAKVGAGLDDAHFTTAMRPDGTTQVAYYGHPLYEFSDDTAGQTNGDGMADAGGHWLVATPEQATSGGGTSSVPASTPASPASGASSGSNGSY